MGATRRKRAAVGLRVRARSGCRGPGRRLRDPRGVGEQHFTPDGRLGVYRTEDGGASWELASGGLPQPAWGAVMREGFSYDDSGVYFGTQSGSVFASTDGGAGWTEVARQLPPILAVEAGEWS